MSKEENTVYVGNKPVMNYMLAVLMGFRGSGTDEVVLKARGNAISQVVDIAEIVRHRLLEGAAVGQI